MRIDENDKQERRGLQEELKQTKKGRRFIPEVFGAILLTFCLFYFFRLSGKPDAWIFFKAVAIVIVSVFVVFFALNELSVIKLQQKIFAIEAKYEVRIKPRENKELSFLRKILLKFKKEVVG